MAEAKGPVLPGRSFLYNIYERRANVCRRSRHAYEMVLVPGMTTGMERAGDATEWDISDARLCDFLIDWNAILPGQAQVSGRFECRGKKV